MQQTCFASAPRNLFGYNAVMMPKLSEDQRQALRDHPGGPIPVEDEQTRQRYVLVEQELHDRAMQALKRQEDPAAIQAGIDDMVAGNVVPFDDVDARIRAKLGMPPRS
jgi:predicted transcriptional regulator